MKHYNALERTLKQAQTRISSVRLRKLSENFILVSVVINDLPDTMEH